MTCRQQLNDGAVPVLRCRIDGGAARVRGSFVYVRPAVAEQPDDLQLPFLGGNVDGRALVLLLACERERRGQMGTSTTKAGAVHLFSFACERDRESAHTILSRTQRLNGY